MPLTQEDFIREVRVRGKLPWQIRWDVIAQRFPDWDTAYLQRELAPKTTRYDQPFTVPEPKSTIPEQVMEKMRQARQALEDQPIGAEPGWMGELSEAIRRRINLPAGATQWGFLTNLARGASGMIPAFGAAQSIQETAEGMGQQQADRIVAEEMEKERLRRHLVPERGEVPPGKAQYVAEQIPVAGVFPRTWREGAKTWYEEPARNIMDVLIGRGILRGVRGRPVARPRPEPAYPEAFPARRPVSRALPEFEPIVEMPVLKKTVVRPSTAKITELEMAQRMRGTAGRNLVSYPNHPGYLADYGRAEAIAYKYGEGKIDIARSNIKAARKFWIEEHSRWPEYEKPILEAERVLAEAEKTQPRKIVVGKEALALKKKLKAEGVTERPLWKDWLKERGYEKPIKQSHAEYPRLIQEYRTQFPKAPRPKSEVELHAGIPLGKITPKFIKEGITHIFHQARNRVKHPLSKQTVEEIANAWGEQGRLRGTYEEQMRQSGFWKIKNKDVELITKHRLSKGKIELPEHLREPAIAVDRLFEDTFAEAQRAGTKVKTAKGDRPIRRVDWYVPRRMRPEIAHKVFDDLVKARKEARARVKDTGLQEDLAFAEIVDAWYRSDKFNPEMKKSIAHLIRTKQAKTPGEAVAMMDEFTANDLFSPFGNIERPRVLDFPADFYDNNIKSIVASYIAGFSKRIPEIKQWGQDASVLTKRQSIIDRTGIPGESKLLRGILQRFTGKTEQVEKPHPSLRTFAESVTNYEVMSKIGFGWASVPQLTQPTISFIPLTRILNWSRAGLDIFNKGMRSWARETGAPGFEQMKSITGMGRPVSKVGRALRTGAEFSTKATMFQQLNKGLQYWSALTGRRWLTHLHKTANSKIKVRREFARRQLKDWGVNPDTPLTENVLKQGSYRFAMDTQLQRNILKEPMWMNNPKWRWLALFKRFGYRQFNLVKDQMWREVKYGNPLPILKLMAGGAMGGEFVIWAKNRLRQLLTGRPHYRDEDNIWHRVINDWAAVGTMGWITDIGRFEEATPVKMFQDMKRTLEFQAKPVVVSDFEKTLKLGDRFLSDLEKRGFDNALRRLLPHVVGTYGGVLAAKFKERLKTPQQYKDVMTVLKRETRQRALQHAAKDNWLRADEIIGKWNENMDPDFWIDYIDSKTLSDYLEHKEELEESP